MEATAMKEQVIFICDDDSDIAEVTKVILERNHYKVRLFSVCNGIVEAAEKEQPALILLDLWMPDTGGEDVAYRLRSNPATRHIPIYLFSAVKDVEAIVTRCGADGFVPKPFDIKQLEGIISSALAV
jgi:DNA-binding response OmpR family regulator